MLREPVVKLIFKVWAREFSQVAVTKNGAEAHSTNARNAYSLCACLNPNSVRLLMGPLGWMRLLSIIYDGNDWPLGSSSPMRYCFNGIAIVMIGLKVCPVQCCLQAKLVRWGHRIIASKFNEDCSNGTIWYSRTNESCGTNVGSTGPNRTNGSNDTW